MICPRCQQENPEGRGFCVRCAYPLPEGRKQEQTPAYEPINFDNQPVVLQRESPLQNAQTRRRPVVLGIVGLAMGVLAVIMALYGVLFLSSKELVAELFSEYADVSLNDLDADMIAGIYGIVFGIFGFVFALLATIFGKKALNRQSAEPNRYMGRGMYAAAFIIGLVMLSISAISVIAGATMLN